MRVIALDLDGVLAQYGPRQSHGGPIGAPMPGMLDLVRRLVREGAQVVVFTARASRPIPRASVEQWLARHGFPALRVTHEKSPTFAVYLDDRAVRFDPHAMDPASLAAQLMTVKPYWEA